MGAHLPVPLDEPGLVKAYHHATCGAEWQRIHFKALPVYPVNSVCLTMEVDELAGPPPCMVLQIGGRSVEPDEWFTFTEALADDVDQAHAIGVSQAVTGKLMEVLIPASDTSTVFRALRGMCMATIADGSRQCRNRAMKLEPHNRCSVHQDEQRYPEWKV
jgi:hypothetical protein